MLVERVDDWSFIIYSEPLNKDYVKGPWNQHNFNITDLGIDKKQLLCDFFFILTSMVPERHVGLALSIPLSLQAKSRQALLSTAT